MPDIATPKWPPDDDEVRAALVAALADGSWGRYEGRHGATLISALQRLLEVEYVYPCCSGTFAVELALRMLKVGPGDEVILAGYDFPGNFRAIEAVGAIPVLVDTVPRRWHLDPSQLAVAASPLVKAVIVSHLHGALAPMREIVATAREQNWQIVEDACQASGAIVDGRPAGTWGEVGTLSFGGSKLLTAGRGGVVITNDPALLQRAKVFCERGNHAYPLSELQSAILVPQVARLPESNERRAKAVVQLRQNYLSLCGATLPLQTVTPDDSPNQPAFYKLGWLLDLAGDAPDFNHTQLLRDALAKALQAEGIEIDAGFRGFGRRPNGRCRKVGPLTAANQAAAGTLVMHHPALLAEPSEVQLLAALIATTALQILGRASSPSHS